MGIKVVDAAGQKHARPEDLAIEESKAKKPRTEFKEVTLSGSQSPNLYCFKFWILCYRYLPA